MAERRRLDAGDRAARLLALIPYVAGQPDGVPIEELGRRFDIEPRTLSADLERAAMVGVYPFSPDTFVDLVVEDGRVWVHLPQWFDRPLRLTPAQGLALVGAARSLLSTPGADPDGPLARGIAKVARALGIESGDDLEVRLGDASPDVVAALGSAIEEHRAVRIDYYAFGRDDRSDRVVLPHRLFADQGNWYLAAWCRRAGDDRVFRVDRIASAEVLDERFEPPAGDGDDIAVFRPRREDPRVVLAVAPVASWVVDQYPVERHEVDADGWHVITLAVAARPWLERLLLRLGSDVRVVDAPASMAAAGPEAARRVLARYGAAPTAPGGVGDAGAAR